MLKLVKSKHMEIARQALRSISSMVLAITSDATERQKYYKTKGTNKNGEFMECLAVLVDCLKSPSSLLQKGATYTLSLLALIDVQLQVSFLWFKINILFVCLEFVFVCVCLTNKFRVYYRLYFVAIIVCKHNFILFLRYTSTGCHCGGSSAHSY